MGLTTKVDFLRGAALDASVIKKLLIEQKEDSSRKTRFTQEKHEAIKFHLARGMSRARLEQIWGLEMVAEALDSEGLQTAQI